MAKQPTPKKIPAKKESSQEETNVEASVQVTTSNGMSHRLGKGLWGIVGSKTRYSTVIQFSGLEYVRYEYRRIPEEYRATAFSNDFLDVIEITEDAPPVADLVDGPVTDETDVLVDEVLNLADVKNDPDPKDTLTSAKG